MMKVHPDDISVPVIVRDINLCEIPFHKACPRQAPGSATLYSVITYQLISPHNTLFRLFVILKCLILKLFTALANCSKQVLRGAQILGGICLLSTLAQYTRNKTVSVGEHFL